MDRIKKRLTILNAVIEAITNPPETVDYPFGELKLPDVFRGAIVINPEKCSGCGLCVRDCPADALVLNKESREEYTLLHYPARCAYCGQCEDSCRRGAISLSNNLVSAINKKGDLVVVLKDCQT